MSIEKTFGPSQSHNVNSYAISNFLSNWNGRSISFGTGLLILAAISLLATGAQAQLYGDAWMEQECGYDYWGRPVCWMKECHYEEVCTHFFGFAECHIEKVCYE